MKNKQLFIALLLAVSSVTSLFSVEHSKATASQLRGLALLKKDKKGSDRFSVLHDYCSENYTEQCAVINRALELINPSFAQKLFSANPTSIQVTIATGQLMSDYVKHNPDVMSNTLNDASHDAQRIQEIIKTQS